jgi:hypothetical protein
MITLKTLPQATEQEVFDQVAVHLLTQMKKSEEFRFGQCVYRSRDGLKCAAGCLIGDDEYKEEMEGITWYKLIEIKKVPESHSDLIRKLQILHDNFQPESWRNMLTNFAKDNNLSINVIETFENKGLS